MDEQSLPLDNTNAAGTMRDVLPSDNDAATGPWEMVTSKPKEPKPLDLADQLRQAIARCGLSLNQLAKETGVHQAQLSRFMRVERSLILTAAAKLCTFLELRLTGPALDKQK